MSIRSEYASNDVFSLETFSATTVGTADGECLSVYFEIKALSQGLSNNYADGNPFFENHYILVLDISGSMNGDPLQQLKKTVTEFIKRAKPSDQMTMITYETNAKIILEESKMSNDNKAAAVELVNNLQTGGFTNMREASEIAIDVCEKLSGHVRVVFVTDGLPDNKEEVKIYVPAALKRMTIDKRRVSAVFLGIDLIITAQDFLQELSKQCPGSLYFPGDIDVIRSIMLHSVQETDKKAANFDVRLVFQLPNTSYSFEMESENSIVDADIMEMGSSNELEKHYSLPRMEINQIKRGAITVIIPGVSSLEFGFKVATLKLVFSAGTIVPKDVTCVVKVNRKAGERDPQIPQVVGLKVRHETGILIDNAPKGNPDEAIEQLGEQSDEIKSNQEVARTEGVANAIIALEETIDDFQNPDLSISELQANASRRATNLYTGNFMNRTKVYKLKDRLKKGTIKINRSPRRTSNAVMDYRKEHYYINRVATLKIRFAKGSENATRNFQLQGGIGENRELFKELNEVTIKELIEMGFIKIVIDNEVDPEWVSYLEEHPDLKLFLIERFHDVLAENDEGNGL
mmetsp:Transcript_16180/g.20743  ORF Transcript_16180/g.20743 Transcript_16180/m.20743 type:complete len:574 (+) Transcript_16180:290-2011(+)|eukprot:CAMPEP_0204865496 /NCGR_PEP_ID=MMETSP1348-20121228/10487_1 /ASSEMBLY_ACC=CAM_ASM_000700 /TAXON_ID=215587 /ORGANISM="Aplanochytrium stocchinoi, Strain GSBS06" /LENGTH=573 /DNA_ID=CAMNT_0052016833 /DNA_START=191 /DNA_END=1912 /DNA_ORIENTATION=-